MHNGGQGNVFVHVRHTFKQFRIFFFDLLNADPSCLVLKFDNILPIKN